MTAPLYDDIHGLALDLVNASAAENVQAGIEAYEALKELCTSHEETELDHPLQWEALGDFSENHENALNSYQKGLSCALKLNLTEYSASIKFAIAETYSEQQNLHDAIRYASEASSEAESICDKELTAAINTFLDEISRT